MLTLSHLNSHSRYTRKSREICIFHVDCFLFFVIFPLLVVFVGKLPLENPFKPADIYFSNFVWMAFWLKWFRPEPYKSKNDHVSLMPATHPQWQHVLAGTGAEPPGTSGGVSGVSLRRTDLVTGVAPSLAHEVGDLHPPDLYSPLQLPLLVSSLRKAPLPFWKTHKLFQVLFLIIWYIYCVHEI